MGKIGILFPHQIFEHHQLFDACDRVYLVEENLFFKQFLFHKQKLAFHRATMKTSAAVLALKNIDVRYVSSYELIADIRLLISDLVQKHQLEELHYIDPTDDWLSQRIEKTSEQFQFATVVYDNPLFINSKADLSTFFRKEKKSFFQTTFYKQQRKKLNLLIDKDGKPEGGKWTFDTENRKKYPKGKAVPGIDFPPSNAFWDEALIYVEKYFATNPGELTDAPLYPLNHEDAQSWFRQFLEFRFHHFGDYEDAIVMDELILNHSVLSPLINIGLLSPGAVVEQSIYFAKSRKIPINSTEGFVRQIIGWREFIRGMYECKGRLSRTQNFWGFKRKIPASFYDGSTGIKPIDRTIKKILKTGYCHHIERLMVLGNFMLLCEFDPDEVYKWFMELFIDAYDWVMVPNVYGMSQFADGGFFATKPYISGSNYLKKMSNYPSGDWQQIWDGLFWRFIDKHQDFFRSNPRLSMMLHLYNRMAVEKKKEHLRNAEQFISRL